MGEREGTEGREREDGRVGSGLINVIVVSIRHHIWNASVDVQDSRVCCSLLDGHQEWADCCFGQLWQGNR